MKNPLFSIIIPTYNHGKFIGRALDSVKAQTFPDWEVVVVNDGSTDNTQEIIDGYSLNDARIHPIAKTNGGTASAINLGLEYARGDWICWLSSDDWYEPDKLEIHKQYFLQHPDCEFFFSHFHMFNEYDGQTLDRDLFGPLPQREFQIPTLFYRNYVMGVGICVSRKLWQRVGRMDTALKYAQDYDMWLKLFTVSPGCFIPERTFTYRHHSGQGSETFQLACLFDASKAAIRYINEHPFKDFFPLLDLNISDSARKSVTVTLEVAGDPSAYVYSLGFHSALVMRLLEWIFLYSNDNRDELLGVVKDFARNAYTNNLGSEFGEIWKRTIDIINNPPPEFHYQPVSHVEIGISHYFQCMSANHPMASPLRKYLESYECVIISDISEIQIPDANPLIPLVTPLKSKFRFASKIEGFLRKILRAIRGI